VEEGDDLTLWKRTEAALSGSDNPAVPRVAPRLFLTHSVADEGRLFPVVECLRQQYQLSVFVCADSIAPGTDWQTEIRNQLERCDRMLFLSSGAANRSTFCGFEAGMATALGKPIHVINLDGTRLPDYLQQIQAIDVTRLQSRKPWLTTEDALLEACLESIL